jgi:hypothetical protein
VVGAVLLAAGAMALYARSEFVTTWLRVACVAPLIFVLLFLFVSPVSKLVSASTPAAADLDVGSRAPVLLVVFDELPTASLLDADGRIDRELFPNFAALADGSMWYRNYTAVSPSTTNAVPAIFTGQFPKAGTVPIASDHPESIFTLLGRSYRLHAKETVTEICPQALCETAATGRGLRGVLDEAVDVFADVASPSRVRRDVTARLVDAAEADPAIFNPLGGAATPVDDFLGEVPKYPRETFHMVHLLLPHAPWKFLPDGRTYRFDDPVLGRDEDDVDLWLDDDWATALGRQRHLLQAQYTDGVLGSIVDGFTKAGLYDEALVIVVADHGIGFVPGHTARGVNLPEGDATTRPEVAWSPLFVKLPGAAQVDTSDANVEAVDVVPTIADVLDVDIPWKVDGRSVLDLADRGSSKQFVTSKSSVVAHAVGHKVEYDGRAGYREMLERNVEAFAPGAGPLRLYRIGPHRSLVGEDARDLPLGDPLPWRVTPEHPDDYGDVDLEARQLASYVRADVRGAPARAPIAVVLNGKVAAVPRTIEHDGDATLGAMIPPQWFRDGRNDLDFFAVVDTPGSASLRPLARPR